MNKDGDLIVAAWLVVTVIACLVGAGWALVRINHLDHQHQPELARLCLLTEPLELDGNLYDPDGFDFYLPCRWMKLEQDV